MMLLIEYRYLASYAIAKLWRILGLPFDPCSLLALRLTNLLLLCFVVPPVTSNLYQLLHPGSSEEHLSLASVLASFPLLSFMAICTTRTSYPQLLFFAAIFVLSKVAMP